MTKYVADVMLGRLARWLRILGYDVDYFRQIDDDDLEEYVLNTGRILITKDTRLVLRRSLRKRSILVRSNSVWEQLEEVVPKLPPAQPFTRCPVCNVELRVVDKEEIKDRVPPYVYRTHEEFSICDSCKRVYWAGTHVEHARRIVDRLNQLMKRKNKSP